jgi:hypothetical protein
VRRAAALAALALLAAGCASTTKPHVPRLPTPRGNVVRIGVTRLPRRRELRHGRVRLRFVKVEPHRALQLFRRGKLDEAPVPLGDIQAVLRDPELRPAVRIRRLRAVDLVVCVRGGALDRLPELRRVYAETADRADYQALVPELQAPAAESLTEPASGFRATPVAFGRARKQIEKLPRVAVRFAEPADPDLAYGAHLLVASWRDLGLGAYFAKGRPDARFERMFDPSPRPGLHMIPIAWAVDARLVSPRLQGWREDDHGRIDYTGVRPRVPSQSP